jgi:predicted anti-sigma-YlaC factor YlaD
MMITCKEASHLLSERLDRDLGVGERARLRVHLAICAACTRVTRQFDFLRRAARAYPGPDEEPPK